MSAMKDPNSMSDTEIQLFFDRQGAWRENELHEIVEKDPLTLAVSSTLKGQDPRWYDQCLRLASQASCSLCGKHPCGDTTAKALVSIKPSQNLECIWGMCTECTASTIGQSKLKVFYRAWFAQIEKKIRPEWLGVTGGNILSCKEGLP